MGLIQKKVNVATGVKSANIFAGTQYEYLERDAKVTVSAIASQDEVYMRWQAGPIILVDDATFTKDTKFPVIPDNILDSEPVLAGYQNVLTFENKNANAADVYYRIDIDYL